MPELPEVETTLRGIRPHIEGRVITAVRVWEPRLRWPVPLDLAEMLQGESFSVPRRRGKYLILPTTQGGSLIIHLGMSGSLRMVDQAMEKRRHDHVEFELSSGWRLRYHDPRRFGCVLWSTDPDLHPLLRDLGPEPFDPAFCGKMLYLGSRKKTTRVKSFIMDHRVVVGVGNIYANEALFEAGILPSRPAGTLALQHYERLAAAMVGVLESALAEGGTTLRDFVNASGQPGYFGQTLQVYGRNGLACRCCGREIVSARLNQRASYWCPGCQC